MATVYKEFDLEAKGLSPTKSYESIEKHELKKIVFVLAMRMFFIRAWLRSELSTQEQRTVADGQAVICIDTLRMLFREFQLNSSYAVDILLLDWIHYNMQTSMRNIKWF